MKPADLNLFETLDYFLSSIGLQKLKSETVTYILYGTDNQTVRKAVLVWVDDIILFGDNDSDIKRSLKQRFRIATAGDLIYFIGIKIKRSRS